MADGGHFITLISFPLFTIARNFSVPATLAVIGNILERLDAGGSGMTLLPTEHPLFLSYVDMPADLPLAE